MIVQMLKNKEVLQDTFLLSNRYDNKSTDIKINLLDEFVNENYFYYLICKSPDKNVTQFAVPLVLDLETKSLTYLVRNNITNTKGNWEFCLLIKEIEIVDGIINDDGLIAICEHFVGKVKSGIITEEELGEQPLVEPLQIIYDILLATNANISANEGARQVFETFDIGKSYKVGNKVSYLGSSYYCIADSSGILPTDTSKWLLIAKKGDKGDIGDTGDKGDIGDTGKGLEFSWNGTQLGVRVEGEAQYQYVDLKGEKGIQGDTGNGISSIVRTSGTGAAGTTDTYTITFTNGSTTTFQVYNGADGLGAGDMLKSVYDKDNSGQVDKADDADKLGGQQPAYYAKATDIPDISSKLDNSHNTDETAHDDIRQSINDLGAELSRTATVVVAASDSKFKKYADYICDGINDEVQIIQALNALPAPQGGKVLLLDGNYYLDSGIYYTTKKNIVISGVGSATKIHVNSSAYGIQLSLDSTVTGVIDKFSIISTVGCESLLRIRDAKSARFSNIEILGNSGGEGSRYGIYTYSASESLIIENCNVQNCITSGIYAYGNNTKIINCTAINNGIGINVHSTANNIIIDGCHVYGNTTQISDNGTNTILGTNYIEGAV